MSLLVHTSFCQSSNLSFFVENLRTLSIRSSNMREGDIRIVLHVLAYQFSVELAHLG